MQLLYLKLIYIFCVYNTPSSLALKFWPLSHSFVLCNWTNKMSWWISLLIISKFLLLSFKFSWDLFCWSELMQTTINVSGAKSAERCSERASVIRVIKANAIIYCWDRRTSGNWGTAHAHISHRITWFFCHIVSTRRTQFGLYSMGMNTVQLQITSILSCLLVVRGLRSILYQQVSCLSQG